MRIRNVSFPLSVAEKIASRGITEEEVYEALMARADSGEQELLPIRREEGLRGGESTWALCRVPSSGRYLSVAFELTADGTAWCYHAMEMTPAQRRQFWRQRR